MIGGDQIQQSPNGFTNDLTMPDRIWSPYKIQKSSPYY